MQWFGESWGAPFNETTPHVDTPVGKLCNGWCEEEIEAGDSGVIMGGVGMDDKPILVCYHRNCYLRQVLGSIGHQKGLCRCFGNMPGDTDHMDDPPGMTLREAADAAVEFFDLGVTVAEALFERKDPTSAGGTAP